MKCLDTYALMEISSGNIKFIKYAAEEFTVTDETLAEFAGVLCRNYGDSAAYYWHEKLADYCKNVPLDILIKAVKFRYRNKSKNFSFFNDLRQGCQEHLFQNQQI